MSRRILHVSAAVLALSVFFLTACGAKPVLISKAAATPVGIDLSGSWLVRDDPDAPRLRESAAARDGLVLSGRSSRSRQRDSAAASVQVFLEFGESLKITQTGFGLFISYDRSVVEEYRFGENRRVAVGPIQAIRVSGWDGESFAVETLDDTGAVLYENWQLLDSGNVLERNIQIKKRDHSLFSRLQLFDRQ